MSVVRYATVECDGDACELGGNAHECYGDGLELTDDEAREVVAELDWSHEDGEDYCPACTAKRAARR